MIKQTKSFISVIKNKSLDKGSFINNATGEIVTLQFARAYKDKGMMQEVAPYACIAVEDEGGNERYISFTAEELKVFIDKLDGLLSEMKKYKPKAWWGIPSLMQSIDKLFSSVPCKSLSELKAEQTNKPQHHKAKKHYDSRRKRKG